MLVVRGKRKLGFELKLTRSPKITPSMRSARDVLELEHLYVVCHGQGPAWPLSDGISAVPLTGLAETLGDR